MFVGAPPRPTDSPAPEIMMGEIRIRVFPDQVRCQVRFTPFVNGIRYQDEARQKYFAYDTPFVDILENVPNVFIDWKVIPLFD